jgi:hypothetical protein
MDFGLAVERVHLRKAPARPRRGLRAPTVAALILGATMFAAVPISAVQNQASPNGSSLIEPTSAHFVRVYVTIYGIFSPRGVFNLMVRLYKLKGLERFKFDMPDALMTLDFKPGVKVEPAAIRDVMKQAGYQPGPFKIQELPISEASRDQRGWLKPPKVESKWALIRWLELNF